MKNIQSPETREALQSRSRQLQKSGQPCKVVTNTEHSIIDGKVANVDDNELTFDSPTERYFIPWETVAYFTQPLALANAATGR